MVIRFTVPGPVPSLKNQKRIAHGRMYCAPEVQRYKEQFGYFVPARYKNLNLGSKTQFLKLSIQILAKDWRRDCEAAIIPDCLQAAGVVSNDRWIRIIEIDASAIDPDNPRAEIILEDL